MPNSYTVLSNWSSANCAQKSYIEDVDDIDVSPAVNPMEVEQFDLNGSLLIKVQQGSGTLLQNLNSDSPASSFL